MQNNFENLNNQEMNHNLEVINDPSTLDTAWPVTAFNEAYPEPGLKGCAIVSDGDLSGDPGKTSLVTLRTFIENGDRAKTGGQKYVAGIRFYSFGDMATLDVISLDKGYHKNIAVEHLKRMNWPTFGSGDDFEKTYQAPFVFVGGFLKTNEDKAGFSGESSDMGKNIFLGNGNDIAAYAASTCGIEVNDGDKTQGEIFVKELLQFMKENKMKPDFYEQFMNFVYSKNPEPELRKSFTGQHLGGLIAMKAADRAIAENKDMTQMVVEEMTGGLGKYALVAGVAAHIKSHNQKEN